MSIQASYELCGRNPDVQTCIADLSNDEVFTPPELANRMLDTLTEAWAAANDGANITQIDAGGILDIAMAGTSATPLARKWESALLVNVDNDTLRRIMENPEAMAAVERIEGWRALGNNMHLNRFVSITGIEKKS